DQVDIAKGGNSKGKRLAQWVESLGLSMSDVIAFGDNYNDLTPTGTGMVASAITFGAIIGALIGGYLTDKIGRYRVFMA
ncbi:HAD hydrolase family protein, partial [Pantoea agglomerans]|uniref:HAD hydrolase family protein n=1 Tax=Enterobacter agglomerans TaxID=549 RepID=UPI001F5DA53A